MALASTAVNLCAPAVNAMVPLISPVVPVAKFILYPFTPSIFNAEVASTVKSSNAIEPFIVNAVVVTAACKVSFVPNVTCSCPILSFGTAVTVSVVPSKNNKMSFEAGKILAGNQLAAVFQVLLPPIHV